MLLYEMMHNNHYMFWAARSLGKTWLCALFCVVRCILYPGTKICVASATRSQANEVLQKIADDFMKKWGWGSDNLCREIKDVSIGAQKAVIEFHNGSWIKVVTAADTARGNRANVLVLDEFRMIDKDTIDTVLKRFMGDPRQPPYLLTKQYAGIDKYLESNIELYLSSCWYEAHWSYEKFKAYFANFLGGREGYFVCGLPYQMAVKEGLKKLSEIEDEMSERDFDEIKFSMEMGCLPFGSTDGAFFSFDDVDKCRRLKNAVYPLNGKQLVKEIPDLVFNERRILSVDIALMASKKHNNDATCIIINSAIPANNNSYIANILYVDTHEGMLTNDLALLVRKLFDLYKCTDLVIDANGVGSGVFDLIIQDIVDPETGKLYPALSVCNNKEMADRCKVDNAPKVIWTIKASQNFNTEICTLLRNGFKNKRINLLISDEDCEAVLKDGIKSWNSASVEEKEFWKAPYRQTTLMVYELIKLRHEIKGSNIKVYETSGMRKDRYSSLAYNYWVQCQLEREELRERKTGFNIDDYVSKLKKLNKKPISY